MQIGQFIKEMDSTRETVRYYIEEELLTPEKISGKYFFSDKEVLDFKNIRELRDAGLTIRVIKKIKANKVHCGTEIQWETNLTIIEDELLLIDEQMKQLANQKMNLKKAKDALAIAIKKGLNRENLDV